MPHQVECVEEADAEYGLRHALFAAYACAGLYISAVCGWASLSAVLEQDGIFAESCAVDDPQRPCLSQSDNLIQVYTMSIVALALSSPLAGCIVDRCAPWVPVLFAGTCVCVGSMAIALLPNWAGPWFTPAFAIVSVGGNATYFAASRLAFFLPARRRPFILSLVSTLYDASSAVPVLFYFAYTGLHASRTLIFASYSVFGMGLFGAWAVAISRARSVNAAQIEEKERSIRSGVPVDVPPIHTEPLSRQLTSLQFWMGLVWFVVHQQYCNLYLGTVKYVLARQGDGDGHYMALFTAMLPCAILCVPAISTTLTKYGILVTMQVGDRVVTKPSKGSPDTYHICPDTSRYVACPPRRWSRPWALSSG
jgi:LAT3 family solute carrier family 43 protein 3